MALIGARRLQIYNSLIKEHGSANGFGPKHHSNPRGTVRFTEQNHFDIPHIASLFIVRDPGIGPIWAIFE